MQKKVSYRLGDNGSLLPGMWAWPVESGSRLHRESKEALEERWAAAMGSTGDSSHGRRRRNPVNKLCASTLPIGIMGGVPEVGVSRRGR